MLSICLGTRMLEDQDQKIFYIVLLICLVSLLTLLFTTILGLISTFIISVNLTVS